MMLALSFLSPWLLAGLLAMGIPLALHLLARSRAQEVLFPTLRFLRLSMQKTARRRRIQHLLLMLLRMGLLGLLAVAVAQPITRAVGGWMRGRDYACVLIVDNSLSMAARTAGGQGTFATRLDRAKTEAKALLSERDTPALAAVLATNAPGGPPALSARLDGLRQELDRLTPSWGQAPIAQRVESALNLLAGQHLPQKSIVIFSDLQRASFEDLARLKDLASAQDVHLLVVDAADRPANNVGVSELKLTGRRLVGQVMTVSATLVNSSATERLVDASLLLRGAELGQKVRASLRPGGQDGSTAVVSFRCPLDLPGPLAGQVVLDPSDDLPEDNTRRFLLTVGQAVRALVVRGPAGQAGQPLSDPAAALNLLLDPYADKSIPWSIEPRTVGFESFSPGSLADVDAVFLCDVPSFTPPQAQALERFVAEGGSAAFVLGPSVDVNNYNDALVRQVPAEGGLLPAPLAPAVGEVGPTAEAWFVSSVDFQHPYFAGLYDNLEQVKQDVRGFVQRYYPLGPAALPPAVLVRLENGAPLVAYKAFGRGKVVLCTTGASHRWSNLAASPLMLSLALRVCLLARQEGTDPAGLAVGASMTIRLPAAPADGNVLVTAPASPDGQVATISVPAVQTEEGFLATFPHTQQAGVYEWRAASDSQQEMTGQFVVNPPGAECDLRAYAPEELAAALKAGGVSRAYVGESLAAVQAAALEAAKPRNWWDLLAALTVVALVVEAVVANLFRKAAEGLVPAHLNPKIAA